MNLNTITKITLAAITKEFCKTKAHPLINTHYVRNKFTLINATRGGGGLYN